MQCFGGVGGHGLIYTAYKVVGFTLPPVKNLGSRKLKEDSFSWISSLTLLGEEELTTVIMLHILSVFLP